MCNVSHRPVTRRQSKLLLLPVSSSSIVTHPKNNDPMIDATMTQSYGVVQKRPRPVTTSRSILRIGNLPPRTTPNQLIRFLNAAMVQANLCYFDKAAVRNCMILGKVAVVKMASPELVQEAMQLNLEYLGYSLEMGRPKNYVGSKKNISPEDAPSAPQSPQQSWNTSVSAELTSTIENIRKLQLQKGEVDLELAKLSRHINSTLLRLSNKPIR